MLAAKGSIAPKAASGRKAHRRSTSGTSSRDYPVTSDPDSEALRVMLFISQQEAEHGVNMYNTLLLSDEKEIDELMARGYRVDDAIAMIFSRK